MKCEAIICDIDGTLAVRADREPYEFNKCRDDYINPAVSDIVKLYYGTARTVILLSGREEKYRDLTEQWLFWHEVPYDKLLMRGTGDGRPDDTVKKEIWERTIKDDFNVLFVLDDRLRTCRMWHKLGLTLLRVGDPDADF